MKPRYGEFLSFFQSEGVTERKELVVPIKFCLLLLFWSALLYILSERQTDKTCNYGMIRQFPFSEQVQYSMKIKTRRDKNLFRFHSSIHRFEKVIVKKSSFHMVSKLQTSQIFGKYCSKYARKVTPHTSRQMTKTKHNMKKLLF